jgi:hypothetical protein
VAGFDVEQFIYIRIPAAIGPQDRQSLFEDAIDAALGADSLGEVSGGGSCLGAPRPDGSRIIEFCGIDVDTRDRDASLACLRRLLPELGVPKDTTFEYTRASHRLEDRFLGFDWEISAPRDSLHPGFDV